MMKNIGILNHKRVNLFTKMDLGTITIALLTLVLVIFLSITTSTFLQFSNIYSILFGVSIQFFAIIGFTYLMIMGELDMSVGAVYGLSGTVLGMLMMNGLPFALSLIITLLVCSLFGVISGFIVTKFRVNSMMVTIGMLSLIKGINWLYIRELQGYFFPASYRALIKFQVGKVHWTILFMIISVITLEILLSRSTIFKKMYYVGANLETARIYGIKSNRIKIITFGISSFTAAIGGILATSRIMHSDVTTGENLEFLMITAAVLGGASLFGGKGSIMKSVFGLIFLAVVFNGMIIFKIDPFIQQVIVGFILIVAVFVDTRLNKRV
ncbi:MAG: hypothetical protein CVU84_00855 [Firmicutes bacterium HGW-Firmicutes-1]|jgi:ribose transport system permease protein|nr:MAG: hypothetical protein CVU84_00855 [Firmicutes bacterium HGW-Firmicutes-1]